MSLNLGNKTKEQLALEKKTAEFIENPSAFAKRNCNACYGRGISGHSLSNRRLDEKGEVQYDRSPVYCGCATRRFVASTLPIERRIASAAREAHRQNNLPSLT